jgi:cytochrome c oxidase subunit II
MRLSTVRLAAALSLMALLPSAVALAGGPENWQIAFPPPGSESKAQIGALHRHVLTIGTAIAVLVIGLLGFIAFRFREDRNPTPRSFSRAPLLEFAWTVLPIALLAVIAAPSVRLIASQSGWGAPELTIKVSAHQWFWRFTYPDNGDISFNSSMIPPAMLREGQPRLLEVDNRLVLPVGVDVQIQVTSQDVVHSFFVPPLGVQIYAVPGRLTAAFIRIDRPGVYYGQCNQICGLNHSFMPIAVEAKSRPDFDAWVARAKSRTGALPETTSPERHAHSEQPR